MGCTLILAACAQVNAPPAEAPVDCPCREPQVAVTPCSEAVSFEGQALAPAEVTLPEGRPHTETLVPVFDDDPSWGRRDAPVTVVEFSDLQCPFCRRVRPTIEQLKMEYGPEKLRVIWKNNPLPFHPEAGLAHEAALAVFEQTGAHGFRIFRDLAFDHQRSLNRAHFIKWAKQAGVINERRFVQALEDRRFEQKIEEDIALARKVGALGTPNFRINGVALSGAQPIEKFRSIVDAQIAAAALLREEGLSADQIYPALVAQNAELPESRPKVTSPASAESEQEVWAVPVYKDDPKRGGAEPLVTIVEFAEFQCPYCKRVQPTLEQVLSTYGDDVQLVWKDNILAFHPRANPAAQVARAVYAKSGDAAFFEVHDALFASQPRLEFEDLVKAASGHGVTPWLLGNAIRQKKYDVRLQASADLATEYSARGTPQFFINGRRLKGAQPYQAFETVIEEELKKARALLAQGVARSAIYEYVMEHGKKPPPPEKKQLAAPPSDAPFRGAAQGTVVIQQFGDFQCPFCQRVNPTIEHVLKKYPKDVKIVWRNLPLPFHGQAQLAAEAAYEVYRQLGSAGFYRYHDRLFENQKGKGLDRLRLEQYAREMAGIDIDAFIRALDARSHQARIEADAQAAKAAGISGTPAFVIGDYYLGGAQVYAAFRKLIELRLAELKQGTR